MKYAALNWRWLDEAAFLQSKEQYERQLDTLIASYPEVARRWVSGQNDIRAAIDEGVRQHGIINGLQTHVPVIVEQPADQVVTAGTPATLSVEAEGSGLRYFCLTAGSGITRQKQITSSPKPRLAARRNPPWRRPNSGPRCHLSP